MNQNDEIVHIKITRGELCRLLFLLFMSSAPREPWMRVLHDVLARQLQDHDARKMAKE